MGDRANIAVQDQGKRVFLYTHWSGQELPQIAADALIRGKDRWDDGPYMARIVFCDLIKGNERGTTGAGISTSIGDNSYPLLVIDCDSQKVTFEDAEGCYSSKAAIGKSFSFSEYIAMKFSDASWSAITGESDE